MRTAAEIVLTAGEEKALTKLSRSNTSSVRLARRARIVLLASQGKDNRQIAGELGIGRIQVGRCRERYDCTSRCDALEHPHFGGGCGSKRHERATDMARTRIEAASDRDLQGFA